MIRVLIAEDNQEYSETLRSYIGEQPDMEVVGLAFQGKETLDYIIKTRPDILLLDIVMPYLDGLGVLEGLVQMSLGYMPKVIVLTAFGKDVITSRAVQLGADYYLLKPVDLEVLVERIRQVVQGKSFRVRPPGKYPTAKPPGKPVKIDPLKIDAELCGTIDKLGISQNLKSHLYLREAVTMAIKDMDLLVNITKNLYPRIADKYHTSISNVQRAIRHAKKIAWSEENKGNTNKLLQVKGELQGDSISNAYFISLLAKKHKPEG